MWTNHIVTTLNDSYGKSIKYLWVCDCLDYISVHYYSVLGTFFRTRLARRLMFVTVAEVLSKMSRKIVRNLVVLYYDIVYWSLIKIYDSCVSKLEKITLWTFLWRNRNFVTINYSAMDNAVYIFVLLWIIYSYIYDINDNFVINDI